MYSPVRDLKIPCDIIFSALTRTLSILTMRGEWAQKKLLAIIYLNNSDVVYERRFIADYTGGEENVTFKLAATGVRVYMYGGGG